MLNVTESVNGKFDIVLSDGYRSQLHDRGKVRTKGELVNDDVVGKRITKPRGKQQVTQRKPKHVKEQANSAKGTKPARIAAKFNGKLPENNQGQTGTNNRSKPPTNETAAFVTKNDLSKLLETLNENNAENVSTIKNEVNRVSLGSSDKNFPPTETSTKDDYTTVELNINENLKVLEKLCNEQGGTVLKQSNPKENVVSTTVKETMKPVAMRSSFAIGAPGLVINNPHDDKTAKHRQWVRELEQQILEKKEREKEGKRNQSVDFSSQIETERTRNVFNRQNNDSVRNARGEIMQDQPENDRSNTGHARGRGLMSMMLSESEVDKQRKKIIEHQKAIELQVEDRRRQKVEERERRLREEALEEDRVAKEREKLQRQFEEEMIKTKQKEDQAKRRALLLQEGISKAFDSAQQLKRDKRKNRMPGAVTVNGSRDGDEMNQTYEQQIILPVDESKIQHKDDTHVVPPLNLSRSFSPVNKFKNSNGKFQARPSDSTVNVRQSSSARNIKTSYSETDKDSLVNKWVNEDFCGSLTVNKEHNRLMGERLSSEVIVPFYRTESATLFTGTFASQEVHESKKVYMLPEGTRNPTEKERKVIKKSRAVPEVQQTRTSRLREKGTDSKNSSLANRRNKHEADTSVQQTGQKQSSNIQITSQKRSDDGFTVNKGSELTNIPSHLLATFTPTAHQQKILEQLAALRKGLLMKDQEIKTRVVNEYEIQA